MKDDVHEKAQALLTSPAMEKALKTAIDHGNPKALSILKRYFPQSPYLERIGLNGVDQVLTALGTAAGGPLAELDADARVAAVTRFQEQEPTLFALMLNTLYYSYYQLPLVVQAIRELGIVYNDAPQPLGYDLPPFEPIPGVTIPTVPRGFYKATHEVERIEWLPPAAVATAGEQ